MKNQIALLLPYFGSFPSYFQLWLDSAELNKNSIDYILVTDQGMKEYHIPDNVTVVKSSFEDLKDHISNQYNFNISLEKPYKLCDYKPAYGEIFKELPNCHLKCNMAMKLNIDENIVERCGSEEACGAWY